MKPKPPPEFRGAACASSISSPVPRRAPRGSQGGAPEGTPQFSRFEMILGNARRLSTEELKFLIIGLEKEVTIRLRREGQE